MRLVPRNGFLRRKLEASLIRWAASILEGRNVQRSLVVSRQDNNAMCSMADSLLDIASRISKGYPNLASASDQHGCQGEFCHRNRPSPTPATANLASGGGRLQVARERCREAYRLGWNDAYRAARNPDMPRKEAEEYAIDIAMSLHQESP